jgi:hypothetical protein
MGALILLLALGGGTAAGGAGHAPVVYRCTVRGTTVYADHPCGADARRVSVSPNVTPHAPVAFVPAAPAPEEKQAAAPEASAPKDNYPTAAAIREAVRLHKVVLCMTPAQVSSAQPPDFFNPLVGSAVYDGEKYTTWRYRPQDFLVGWPMTVRFRGGRVVGWSDKDRIETRY